MWDLIGENRPYITFSVLVFFLGVFWGFVGFGFFEDILIKILGRVYEDIVVEGESFQTAKNIIFRNLCVTFILIASGVTLIFPLLVVFGNGFLVGLVAKYSIIKGIPASKVIYGLAPHGLFELAAFFTAAGLSLRIGSVWFERRGSRISSFKR